MGPISELKKCLSCLIRSPELPRQRDERGVWRPRPPYAQPNVRVARLALPALLPAYLEPSDGPWAEDQVPPALWRAMQPGLIPRLWGKQGGDPVVEVQAVLNRLAACLYPRARSRWRELDQTPTPLVPLGDAFRFPLAEADFPGRPACMWLDPVLVARSKGIRRHVREAKDMFPHEK